MHLRKRIERDALIIRWLGYGTALLFVYFALDETRSPNSEIWAGLSGAVAFAALGHLVSWVISNFPENPRKE